ncbi:MAG: hypothetical protein NTZ35_08680 [Ignavibacteriales bacterium]|nr:hypothetical protein [Ignavibacteriales bacterium]
MPDVPSTQKKFQWKWVWISLLMYVVFYFFPLTLVPGGMLSGATVTKASAVFIGVWSFAGMIVISGVAGYISKGVTIKEPAAAAVGLVILSLVAVQIKFNSAIQITTQSILGLVIALAVVAGLSLAGAWFGEILQRVLQSKGPEPE